MKRVEIKRLAEEVHRHNRAGPRPDLPGGVRQVEVVVMRIDVDPDRGGAEPNDGASGGEESERREEDFVALANIECHERKQERVRTGRDAEGVLHAEERSAILLEGLDPRAHDELIGAENVTEGGLKLRLEGAVLGAEIKERDVHHGAKVFPTVAPHGQHHSAGRRARQSRQRPNAPSGSVQNCPAVRPSTKPSSAERKHSQRMRAPA